MQNAPESPQTNPNKVLDTLKILTMNVRGLYKSQWDLHHTIATHNPDVLVLTETKLHKINKDRTWLDVLLKSYHHWSAFDWTGGTTICVRKALAIATQCFPTCRNSEGKIASVVLKGNNANLHLIGTGTGHPATQMKL